MRYYAGIGSRKTPESLKEEIQEIVEFLESQNYILRSGGADGADLFFEEFATRKEIYLPWKGFNGSDSDLFSPSPDSHEIAKKYHPAWDRLSSAGQKLMARNSHQVLGIELETPSDFIVCWTEDGKMKGGTSQALRIAKDINIPIFNLYDGDTLTYIKNFLKIW